MVDVHFDVLFHFFFFFLSSVTTNLFIGCNIEELLAWKINNKEREKSTKCNIYTSDTYIIET